MAESQNSDPKPFQPKIDKNKLQPEMTTAEPMPPEIGGREGPEPTRYGDWEKNGRCIDF